MIADNLRRLRRQHALSVQDLADRSGVAASTVTRIEQGQADPRPSTLRRFAEVFEVPPDALTTESPDEVPPPHSDATTNPQRRRSVGSPRDVPAELRGLADAEQETSPFAALTVHEALQQVAHHVIPAVRASPTEAAERLPALADAARALSGPVQPSGEALGCLLEGLHHTLRAGDWSSQAENVRIWSKTLLDALQPPDLGSITQGLARTVPQRALVDAFLPAWRPALESTCRTYAALLVAAAPPVFHEEVTLFTLDLARLRLDALRERTARVPETSQLKAVRCAREATTALGSILTSFDVANQSHPYRDSGTELAASRVPAVPA
jgi:transcriptional regulator with XRE-family HTH domain